MPGKRYKRTWFGVLEVEVQHSKKTGPNVVQYPLEAPTLFIWFCGIGLVVVLVLLALT